jgi:glycosyltransferase involved in cell wall biosynthesis
MKMMFLIFLFLSLYSYLIYPGVLFFLSKIARHPWTRKDIKPTVSIIISVYNEESIIGKKIQNALALDYSKELLEVIVSSDGSTDQTTKIVSEMRDSRLLLRDFPDRSGKTTCLNRVVPDAKGDIILFTDANSMFPPDMLATLVKNFNSPEIGLVTGWTKYQSPGEQQPTAGMYSRLEKTTKHVESSISSCVGADGAVFAIKKYLYKPLKEHDINDFIIPLHVIEQGKRVVLDPDVFCVEDTATGGLREYQRQVRITTRTLGAIRRNAVFMNPLSFGVFSFFLISHKVIRFLVPFFVLGLFVTNLFLLPKSPFYILTFSGQILFVAAGIANVFGIVKGRISTICKFFLITLSAQLIGWIRMFIGIEDTMWTPQR